MGKWDSWKFIARETLFFYLPLKFNSFPFFLFFFYRSMKQKIFHFLFTLLYVVITLQTALSTTGKLKEVCQPKFSEVRITVAGCHERKVKLPQCTGTCLSEESRYGKTCWCCRPVQRSPIAVEIYCKRSDGRFYVERYKVQQHTQCSCSRCLDN